MSSFLTSDEIEALERPTGKARGLPGRVYGAEFFELEQERLFPRSWCAVGFASDVPNPGDIKPVELAGWPVLLVRGGDGRLRAFLNICRHRAMRVVSDPCKNVRSISCPWHKWTYDLEGTLIGTPRIGGQQCNVDPEIDLSDLSLQSIAVAQWQDLVFVNLDGRAPPFEAHIAPWVELVSDYDLEALNPSGGFELDYPGNWKITVEGAVEDYHLFACHPQILSDVLDSEPATHWSPRCFYAVSSTRRYEADADATEKHGVHDRLPSIRSANEGIAETTYFAGLFPTGFVQLRLHYLILATALPDGPDRTRLVFKFFYKGDAAADPSLAETRDNIVNEWQLIFEQDIPYMKYVHLNHKCPDIRRHLGGTRYAPAWEKNVHRFDRDVVAVMED